MADYIIMTQPYPSLRRFKIPHKIIYTDTLIKLLMRIAETKPFLDEYLGSSLEVNLLRKAKVRAITYSNQIEGNDLSENEVTAVLQGKRVAGSKKDIQEVQNYHSALEYVEQIADSSQSIKISDLCDIQRLITRHTIPDNQCGRIRSIQVSIVNSATQEKIEECPEPFALQDLMNDLWQWLEDTKDLNPFIRACAFHFIAVSIHPFADGNGRTMRLMQHLLLLRGGEKVARFVPSETAIMKNRNRYYSSIRQSRALKSMHPILEFLLESFATTANEVVEEGRKLLRSSAGKTPEARQRKIISNAKKTDTFSAQDVIRWLPDIPKRTLERDLAGLVRNRIIKAKGKNKARTYQLIVLDTKKATRIP